MSLVLFGPIWKCLTFTEKLVLNVPTVASMLLYIYIYVCVCVCVCVRACVYVCIYLYGHYFVSNRSYLVPN